MKSVFITGISGFIGNELSKRLEQDGIQVSGSIRGRKEPKFSNKIPIFESGNIDSNTNWEQALKNIDCIVHTAAIAHSKSNTFAEYLTVNYKATATLARQAASNGVKRFIFISSIGVNGNYTENKKKFKPSDIPQPTEKYAISKWIAEKVLREISNNTGLDVVIIRPPLVYGPNAKGNFGTLIKYINKGFPIPLGSVNNIRSFIGLDNLIDFICCCINHPNAPGNTFLVSDNHDLSTKELISIISKALGQKPNFIPFPYFGLKLLSKIFGKSNEIDKLFNSLQVDSSMASSKLNWTPRIPVEEQIFKLVNFFLNNKT